MRETQNRTQVAWKMDELRSWWEVPSIAHFCSLFRSAFDLTDFDIEDLEDAFLESQRDEGSDFLTDLVCKLLNGCYHRKDITVLNYDLYVKDVIKYKWEGTGNPIAEKSEFKELALRDKVELIYAICEYRLDGDDVPELLKGFEGDNMRIEPLGKDKDGGTYWYFYGSRLYKEDPPPKKEVSKEEKRGIETVTCSHDAIKRENMIRAKDKQRRKELNKKRREEKRQKKLEKQKRKSLKKARKKSKAESEPVVEAEDDGNIRRSGRLRIKKELKKFISESSESSSSSEDEIEDTSSEDEEEEEDCEEDVEEEQEKTKKGSKKTPAKKTAAKKTPAKKTPAKKTPAKKTPAKKQEDSTPSGRPQRQSVRQRGKSRTSVEETPELDSSVRRSGRIRGRRGVKSRKDDSDTEEEVKDDIDSGHESGVTDDDDDTKSETSKLSIKSSMSKSSQKDTAAARRITLPRASANIEKGSMSSGDEEEEKDVLEQKDEEKEVQIGENKSDEINEQNPQTNSTGKDLVETSTTENVQKENRDICESKEQEVSNTECSSPKNEKPHLPTESDGLSEDSHMKDKNDTNVEEMEVEESAHCDNSEDIESNLPSEVGTTDAGMLVDEKDKLENDSTDEDSTRNLETIETEQCLESCQKEESKSQDEEAQVEEDVAKDTLTAKVECKPDIKESEQPVESDPKCERTELVEKGEKVNHEKDAGDKIKLNSPVKDIDNENTDFKEIVERERTNNVKNNCEQSDDVKDIKTEEEDLKDIKMEDEDVKGTKTEGEAVKDIKTEDEAVKDVKTEDAAVNDIKTEDEAVKDIKTEDDALNQSEGKHQKEDLKTEINEKSMKTEDIEQENDNDEEMETEEKEKTDTGPKTTLGKHKPFVSSGDSVPQSKSETRWHMVCSSLDDWVNLAEWFSNSQVRCEKSLFKLIKEDFLPVLPEIIEAREKERKRRLAELDVRRSNRITLKMKEKIEQEKILAEALALEEKEKQLAEEERRLKEEQQKLEEENRLREERLKAREERANRLSMREVRSRLIAEGKEIPPELLYTATNKYNDDYDSDDSRNDLKTDEDYNNLSRLVEAMKIHRDCWPFLDPVTDEVAPGYSDVIKRPMDLTKIEEKVKKRDYKSTQHFLSDFRLMFNNCKRFNGPESEFTECAKTMETVLKKYRKRFLTDDPGSSSYYQDKDFILSVKGGKQADKRYRPRRAASSKAMETVHRALASSDEECEESDSDDEEEEGEPSKKRKRTAEFPATQSSHQSLLLQEMIEMKRQREKNLAASARENHQYITRPGSLKVKNPQGGVTIIPKHELPTQGLLKLASTREIKRKVNPQFSEMVDLAKKDPGLSVSSNSAHAGPGKIKTIRIVAPTASNPSKNAVKETAESVKVSADGFLIIGGKNSGIKVSDNTKIVIQPPGSTPSTSGTPAQGREVYIKKIPTPSGMKEIPAGASSTRTVIPVTGGTPSSKPNESRSPAILNVSGNSQIRNSPGNIPNVVRQHQILNRGLNSSSGIVTQNPQEYEGFNQGNTPQNTASLQLKQKMMLQKKHQQQNGTSMQSGPPKIIKLSTNHSNPSIPNPNQRSIEERLREPNLDKVSENVVKSVNIAGDILDSYYSVYNSSNKSSQPHSYQVNLPVEAKPVTQTARSVNENQSHISPDIKSLLLQSMVNNGTITNSSSPSLGHLNQPATPVCNGSLPQRPVGVVNSHAMYGSTSNSTNVITNSPVQLTSSVHGGSVGQGSVGLGVGQIPSNTIQQNTTSHIATHSSTQNLVQIPVGISSSSNLTPIEALFTGNSTSNVMSNRQDVPIVQNIAVSAPVTLQSATIQNELLKPVPSNIRQNVFDVFGSNKNANSDSQGNDIDPEFNLELPSKELLRGLKGQSSGTINFGSPLRTMSVMEALKSKLSQSPKPEHQQVIKKSTPDMNALGVIEKVASNACVSSNPVVTCVLTSYSHARTCSIAPATSPTPKIDSSNNLTDYNTGINQPGDLAKGSSRMVNRIKKKNLCDSNGNILDGADVQYETFTDETSVEEQLKDAQKSGKELEKGMTENEPLDEIELGRYQFDSQTECWQMVESESIYDNHHEDETAVTDMTFIDPSSHQSTVLDQVGRQGPYGCVRPGMNTGIEKDNMQSKIQEGNEGCGQGEAVKQKNMYMIMIPNNGTSNSTVTQLPAIYPNDGQATYLNDFPKKRTRVGKGKMAKYTRDIPKDESSIVALNSIESEKMESYKHGNGLRSRSLGKVHFQPSQQFEFPSQRTYRSGFTRGPLSVRRVKSTSELSADELTRDAAAIGEPESATVNQSMDEDNDIEQYLNQMRAKQKASRVTTNPIRTYQLCASMQDDRSSPKCLSLRDIVVSTRHETDVNTEIQCKPQSVRKIQARNRQRMLTKRNSYVVKKHSGNAPDNAHMRPNDLDDSLTCDEDFFSSEVLSNLFPPNLGDGDSETDNVFKHIEHELFDLQDFHDQAPRNQPWDQNIQTPALNHQFMNTSYTGTEMVGMPFNVSEQTSDKMHTNHHHGVMANVPDVMRGSYPAQHLAQTTQHHQRADPDTMSPFSPTSILNVGTAQVVSSNIHHSLFPDGKELGVTALSGLQGTVEAGNSGGSILHGNGEFSDQSVTADGVLQFVATPFTQTGEPTS